MDNMPTMLLFLDLVILVPWLNLLQIGQTCKNQYLQPQNHQHHPHHPHHPHHHLHLHHHHQHSPLLEEQPCWVVMEDIFQDVVVVLQQLIILIQQLQQIILLLQDLYGLFFQLESMSVFNLILVNSSQDVMVVSEILMKLCQQVFTLMVIHGQMSN